MPLAVVLPPAAAFREKIPKAQIALETEQAAPQAQSGARSIPRPGPPPQLRPCSRLLRRARSVAVFQKVPDPVRLSGKPFPGNIFGRSLKNLPRHNRAAPVREDGPAPQSSPPAPGGGKGRVGSRSSCL